MKKPSAGLLVLLVCISCRASSPIDLPHRAPPPGYPAPHAGDLPRDLAPIPEEHFARALSNRIYRVRWGTFPARCEDCPVDALSGAEPLPAEGPFETEVEIAPSDVSLRLVTPAPILPAGKSPHRLVACVDIKPSRLPHTANRDTILLDVQPIGHDPPMPLVVDAITGERLTLDPTRLADENNRLCDTRLLTRMFWDDNLRRFHQARAR